MKRNSYVFAALIVVTGFTVFLAAQWQQTSRELKRSEELRQIASQRSGLIEAKVSGLEEKLTEIEFLMPDDPETPADQYWYQVAQDARMRQHDLMRTEERQAIQAGGLADPVPDLRSTLLDQVGLIPFEGSRGSAMSFEPSAIAPLTDRWVFARFSDGHVDGSCLLKYEIAADGTIDWTVLEAHLDS